MVYEDKTGISVNQDRGNLKMIFEMPDGERFVTVFFGGLDLFKSRVKTTLQCLILTQLIMYSLERMSCYNFF